MKLQLLIGVRLIPNTCPLTRTQKNNEGQSGPDYIVIEPIWLADSQNRRNVTSLYAKNSTPGQLKLSPATNRCFVTQSLSTEYLWSNSRTQTRCTKLQLLIGVHLTPSTCPLARTKKNNKEQSGLDYIAIVQTWLTISQNRRSDTLLYAKNSTPGRLKPSPATNCCFMTRQYLYFILQVLPYILHSCIYFNPIFSCASASQATLPLMWPADI